MDIDTTAPRSRRSLLAAAIGGASAVVAATLGRAAPVRAANGDPVVVGTNTQGSSPTTVTSTGSMAALAGQTAVGGGDYEAGIGVSGVNTAAGDPPAAWGVYGESPRGIGVRGRGRTGVLGLSGFTGLITDFIAGGGAPNTGVMGMVISNDTLPPASMGVFGKAATGVYGEGGTGVRGSGVFIGVQGMATTGSGVRGDATSGNGVKGVAPAGTGVRGEGTTGVRGEGTTGVRGVTTTGNGVFGDAATGHGVHGRATGGVGLYGEATNGYALRTKGRIRFDGSSGIATIPTGQRSVTVTPGIDLTSSSGVVATLQAAAGGTTTVHRCPVDPATNTFIIYLTTATIVPVKVAWIVVG